MSEFEVQTGKHVLVLSSSQFDPTLTFARGRFDGRFHLLTHSCAVSIDQFPLRLQPDLDQPTALVDFNDGRAA